MEILLGTVCVCLLVILCVLLWKYISVKEYPTLLKGTGKAERQRLQTAS